MKRKLIITGSRGVVGTVLCKTLANDFDIYSIDSVGGDNVIRVSVSDFGALKSVFKRIGADYLVHLAAESHPKACWSSILKNNIVGTKNVYECARISGIKRVVFASSNHVTGAYEGFPPRLHKKIRPRMISVQDPIRPDGDYGTSKAFGEALARQYFELYNLKSICLRIGTVDADDDPTKDRTGRLLKTWLSHRDLTQLVKKSLLSKVKFGVYYGVSNNKGMFWDISNAKEDLGYKPVDGAR
jgi:nucleoside-diphosphate-sugar epimerase